MVKIKFGNKDFSFYWKAIKVPLLILVLWSVAAVVVAKISLYWYNRIFAGFSGLLLQLAIFAFIGYTIIDDYKGLPKESAYAGALTGVIAGLIGAVISVISLSVAPEIFDMAAQNAVSQGAPEEMIRQMINISVYIGFVTGPLFGGLFGALVSWVSGLIAHRRKKKRLI